MIRVLVADDHALVRDGLRALLRDCDDMEVVGDAANGREAVEFMKHRCADVAVIDMAMPELNGIEATQRILECCTDTGIIILSMYSSHEYIYRAFHAGARGYLLKESAGAEVIDAIRIVRGGSYYLGRKIPESVLYDFLRKSPAAQVKGPLSGLSRREREILQLVTEGKSSAEIAELLHISRKTVETYRSRLMAKLGTDSLPALIRFAIKHGLTPLN